MLKETFGSKKPIIAMAHFPALPGSPGYNAKKGMNHILDWVGADIEKLPVHHKGEILSGLTQSAQRLGRTDEAARHLDRMLIVLAGTPYESLAKQWKADPAIAATTNLTCRNCHTAGRLENRIAALNTKAPGH